MKRSIPSAGPGAPRSVPRPGGVSSVGPSGKAPAPRLKNTRDYGKKDPAPVTVAVSPFGSADSSGSLGGI